MRPGEGHAHRGRRCPLGQLHEHWPDWGRRRGHLIAWLIADFTRRPR